MFYGILPPEQATAPTCRPRHIPIVLPPTPSAAIPGAPSLGSPIPEVQLWTVSPKQTTPVELTMGSLSKVATFFHYQSHWGFLKTIFFNNPWK
jgi:hypothetical protein